VEELFQHPDSEPCCYPVDVHGRDTECVVHRKSKGRQEVLLLQSRFAACSLVVWRDSFV
jgi:hypothetical protein